MNDSPVWLSEQLLKMRDIAQELAQTQCLDTNVIAILLFGSVASGNIHPESDLDLVTIRRQDKPRINRTQTTIEGVEVDQWEHPSGYYESLIARDWDPKDMFQYSLFLGVLQNAVILYDRENRFGEYKEKAQAWKWPQECLTFIHEKINVAIQGLKTQDLTELEKSIYRKKLLLLETCMKLVEMGKPVSIRNKDLYKSHLQHSSTDMYLPVFGIPSVEDLTDLVEQGFTFFHSEILNREPYTELVDAKKHYVNGEKFLSSISLQNGAYYIGLSGLSNRDIKLENQGFLNPESEIELIRKTNEVWPEFYHFYERLHSV